MSKKQSRPRASRSADGSANGSAPESLQQVREILFGTELRALESGRADLEGRLGDLQTASDARFDALEARLTTEIAALTERERVSQREAREALRDVEKELRQAHRKLEQQVSKLQEQVDKMAAALEERADELHTAKVDTSALSTLLAEMAQRLDRKSSSKSD